MEQSLSGPGMQNNNQNRDDQGEEFDLKKLKDLEKSVEKLTN